MVGLSLGHRPRKPLANPELDLETLTGEQIVESLENSESHAFYNSNDKENWSGIPFLEKLKSKNTRGLLPATRGSNESGEDATSQDDEDNSQVTGLSSSMIENAGTMTGTTRE